MCLKGYTGLPKVHKKNSDKNEINIQYNLVMFADFNTF